MPASNSTSSFARPRHFLSSNHCRIGSYFISTRGRANRVQNSRSGRFWFRRRKYFSPVTLAFCQEWPSEKRVSDAHFSSALIGRCDVRADQLIERVGLHAAWILGFAAFRNNRILDVSTYGWPNVVYHCGRQKSEFARNFGVPARLFRPRFPIRNLLTRASDRNNFRGSNTTETKKESWLHPDSSIPTSSTA